MIYDNWVIDGSLSKPLDGLFCFVPIADKNLITGVNVLSSKPPGKLVGVVHPDGQDAADAFYEQYKLVIDDMKV